MSSTRSPSELLATLLLGDRGAAWGAARETGERSLWANAIELAKIWRVVPALSGRLSPLGVELEPVLGEGLSAAVRQAAIQSTVTCLRAGEALAALATADVRSIAFKGVAAVGYVYGSPARRMLQDADLLVDEDDVRRAITVLEEIGFALELPIELESWLALLADRVYRDHEYVELRDGDGAAIDLHWFLPFAGESGLAVDDLLLRARRVTVGGRALAVGSPEDCLLLTVHHAVRDRLVPRVTIKDLLDLDGWFSLDDLDREIVSRRALTAGLFDPLVAMAEILVDFDPGATAARWLAETAVQNRRQVDRLTAFFRLQLREGEISRGLLGLSAMSLPMLGRFVASRWKSLWDAEYRALFRHHDLSSAKRPRGAGFLQELIRVGPSRLRLVRAMARETRKLA